MPTKVSWQGTRCPAAGVGPSKRLSFKTSRREETRLDCQAGFLEVKSVVVTTL